ncbi:uncharacterized protein ACNS7B_001792 isoform 50-T50 [Menidia menidia]
MRTLILVLLLVYVSAGPLPGAGTRSGSRARFRSSSGSSPLANNGSSSEGPIPEPIRRAVFCGGPRPEMDITGAIILRPKVDQNSTGIMIFSNGSQPDSNISRMAFSNGSQPDSNISRMAFSNGSQPDSNISRMILSKGPIPEQDTITGAGFFRPPPPPGGCFLGTCALAKLGEDLQSGGDESAGDLTKHAFGPGK